MKETNLYILKVLENNYSYVLEKNGNALVVDPGDAEPIINFIKGRGLNLTHILITHFHNDHIGGVKDLEEFYDLATVFHGCDCNFNGLNITNLNTPGHTLNDSSYYIEELKIVFTGDTLFSGGCGRMFLGTKEEFFNSLNTLKSLPRDTRILSGHEYLEYSIKFNNKIGLDTQFYSSLLNREYPSLWVTVGDEINNNPFFNVKSPQEFGELRTKKDRM